LENARKRLKGRSAKEGTPSVQTLERAHAALSEERLLRDERFDDDARKDLRGLAPLSR
jgi:hypothetical protein